MEEEEFTLDDVLEQVYLPDENQDLVTRCRQENGGGGAIDTTNTPEPLDYALPRTRSLMLKCPILGAEYTNQTLPFRDATGGAVVPCLQRHP